MGGESGPHLKGARLLCPLVHRRCGSLKNLAEPCLLAYLRGPEMKTLKRVQFQRGSSFGGVGAGRAVPPTIPLTGRQVLVPEDHGHTHRAPQPQRRAHPTATAHP